MANSKYADNDWCPTRQQELLLQAALMQGPKAIDAWDRWRSSVDIEKLDPQSRRLLPQLYYGLRRQGVSDPTIARFKDTYRRTWYENRSLFHAMSGLLRSLHEAGIQTALLKGAALVLQYYGDYGLRPMYDFDILIPAGQRSPALELIHSLGFTPVWDTRETTEVFASRHGWDFKDADGRQVDLHWRVFHDYGEPEADIEFWKAAVPVMVHGIPSRTLNPADQLLHVCVHGATWMDEPAVHWVADATTILRAVGGKLDWDRLLVQARRYHYTVLLRVALQYLHEVVDAPVPPALLQRMNEMPASRAERIVYKTKTRDPRRWGPWLALCVRYLEHASTLPANAGAVRRLAGFPEYFRRRWKGDSMWQVAVDAPLRGMRRVAWAAIAQGRRLISRRSSMKS